MFDLINGTVRFMSDLFEPDPHQDCTADMVADNSGFPALTTFQTGQWFGFAVKLLNLPAQAAHLLDGSRVVLSEIVGNDVIRALRASGQHHPEKFHLMLLGKALELDHFAMLLLRLRPLQSIHPPVRLISTRIVHLAVVFERAVVDFLQVLNQKHAFLGRIPAIHPYEAKHKVLLIDTMQQHILDMIQFGFAIPVRIINSIIDDPKLVQGGVDVHACYNAHPFDDPVCVSTPLPPHQFHLEREILVYNCVIEHQVSFRKLDHLSFDVFPYQVGRDFFSCQIAVDRIMAKFLAVLPKVRQRIVNWADQQILAIIQTSNRVFVLTSLPYSHSAPFVKSLPYFAYVLFKLKKMCG